MTRPARSTRRSILGGILAGGVLAALALPAAAGPASADADAPECGDHTTIAGQPTLIRTLADGVVLRSWASTISEVAVVSSEPGAARLRAWTAPSGTVALVRSALRSNRRAVAAVNGDFFRRTGLGYLPLSDVVRDGEVKHLLPGSVPALTIDLAGRPHATTVHATGSVTLTWSHTHKAVAAKAGSRHTHTAVVGLSGVNTAGTLSATTAVLFTRTWPTTVPAPERVRILHMPGTTTPHGTRPPTSALARPARPWIVLGSEAAKRLAGVPGSAAARVHWSVRAGDGSAVRDAIGRGATLLRDGSVITDCAGVDRPRTAVGWDAAGHVWLITAQEGVHPVTSGYGARWGGTTNFQMGQWLHQLGATDGVTLDGGGSTDLEVRTSAGLHRADMPDDAFARLVPNGLVLVASP